MVKSKYLIFLFLLAGSLAACRKSATSDNYDPNPQFRIDTSAIRALIIADSIPAIKDPSGIFYQVIADGSGKAPTLNNVVSVEYEGRLLDGTVFDKTDGTPVDLPLNNLIGGWQIGLPKIQKGGKIRLLIPSYYGYGTVPKQGIPPNSTLDFTITLRDVK
ncbi:FKBP-type peptidyl-prolyl cis-trans isomerase FkpA [Pedobacter sp. UYP30]|uniref:FKBP-type peptidyl-prolyl cis-trans isomerase n=1 Tax=Pedobacter sp. UYP30 TaxID=1756400 RepID=UPI0033910191